MLPACTVFASMIKQNLGSEKSPELREVLYFAFVVVKGNGSYKNWKKCN